MGMAGLHDLIRAVSVDALPLFLALFQHVKYFNKANPC